MPLQRLKKPAASTQLARAMPYVSHGRWGTQASAVPVSKLRTTLSFSGTRVWLPLPVASVEKTGVQHRTKLANPAAVLQVAFSAAAQTQVLELVSAPPLCATNQIDDAFFFVHRC